MPFKCFIGSEIQVLKPLQLQPASVTACVFLLFARASYYEISVDDGPWEKQKSSGLSICTGTGSKAWYV